MSIDQPDPDYSSNTTVSIGSFEEAQNRGAIQTQLVFKPSTDIPVIYQVDEILNNSSDTPNVVMDICNHLHKFEQTTLQPQFNDAPPNKDVANVSHTRSRKLEQSIYRFKLTILWGRKKDYDLVQRITEHCSNLSVSAHPEIVRGPGEIRRMEAKAKDPKVLLENIIRSITTVNRPITLTSSDLNIYSKKLELNFCFPLLDISICTLSIEQIIKKKWTFNYSKDSTQPYSDFLRKNFHVEFHFDNSRILAVCHIWNILRAKNDCYQLEHYTLTVEPQTLRRIIVRLPLDYKHCELLFECDSPLIVKKRNITTSNLQDNQDLFASPELRVDTISRGQSNYEKDGARLFLDNRCVLMSLSTNRDDFYLLLSRFSQKFNIEIVYATYRVEDCFTGNDQFYGSDPFEDENYQKRVISKLPDAPNLWLMLTIRLKALADLGGKIRDQIFQTKESFEDLVSFIVNEVSENPEKAFQLLEAVISFSSQSDKTDTLLSVLHEFKDLQKKGELPYSPATVEEHFEKCECIELTPLGTVFKKPEIHYANMLSRFLKRNKFMPMLRASIRSESGQKLRWTLKGELRNGKRRIDKQLKEKLFSIMKNGVKVFGENFVFFAASGSQQREGGMYLIWEKDVDIVRQAMGNYESIANPSRRLAREGQCASQAMECPIFITPDMWKVEKDITYRYAVNSKEEPYTWTDGSGRISKELMEEICKTMRIYPCIPEGFQFRFGGFKGMLYVDRRLKGRQIVFRDSQKKYESGTEYLPYLQIIMFTCPQAAIFSPSYINIIDQNSMIQNIGQSRIKNCVLDLNEQIFKDLSEAHQNEEKFRKQIERLPAFIDITKLPQEWGFVLHQEPFFSSLLSAYSQKTILTTIGKSRVIADSNTTRSAHGAPDDLGLIPEGCVYFQPSRSVNVKFPNPWSPSDIWEGDVFIGKYPCCDSGDLRRLTAVDIKQYHGQVNKLIFSAIGSRPIFDMLSGSDCDGDIFIITKEQNLMPATNEKPMDYTATSMPIPVMNGTEQKNRINTYLKCIEEDIIGLASVSQLIKSDEHGIQSRIAKSLARKTAKALDRPKTGNNPSKIRCNWGIDAKGNYEPPELPFRRPNFKSLPSCCPTYKSKNLNGEVNEINRQLKFISEAIPKEKQIELNPIFLKLYEKYFEMFPEKMGNVKRAVLEDMASYNRQLKNILNEFMLNNEAELFSGCHISGKSFKKDEDEYDSINTRDISLRMVGDLFAQFRQRFFNACDSRGYLAVTQYEGRFETEDVLKRTVISPNDIMRMRAITAYTLCYKSANEGDRLLSYAWLAYDVLALEQDRFTQNEPSFNVEEDSFYKSLEIIAKNLMQSNDVEYRNFCNLNYFDPFVHNWIIDLRKMYGETIDIVMFSLIQWGISCGLLDRLATTFQFDVSRLAWICIALGHGCIPGISPIFGTNDTEEGDSLSVGNCLASLLSGLASRLLVKIDYIVYGPLLIYPDGTTAAKVIGKYGNDEINQVFMAARRCYYYMLIHQDFSVFYEQHPYYSICEREKRIIELPENADLEAVEAALKRKIMPEDLILRRIPNSRTCVLVMYRGSCDTEEKLRKLVEIPPPQNVTTRKDEENYYSQAVYYRIISAHTLYK